MFNLALLAKQAWRVIQDPNSLSAQIWKGVYFPSGDLLDVVLGSSPSRIWRSILEGREVLQRGLIRRIRDGESTEIWSMNWLPKGGSLKPLFKEQENPLQCVSDLIDASVPAWNKQRLVESFHPADVEVIINIPLCTRNQSDFWAWHYEKIGLFFVRSAYKMLVLMKEQSTSFINNVSERSDTRAIEKE
jgi:hypothetical protein